MKKKLFFAGAVLSLAAAVTTAFVAYDSANGHELLNANVEALADGEVEVGEICVYTERLCYSWDGTQIPGVRSR